MTLISAFAWGRACRQTWKRMQTWIRSFGFISSPVTTRLYTLVVPLPFLYLTTYCREDDTVFVLHVPLGCMPDVRVGHGAGSYILVTKQHSRNLIISHHP